MYLDNHVCGPTIILSLGADGRLPLIGSSPAHQIAANDNGYGTYRGVARILHWGHQSWAPKARESRRYRRREGWGLGTGCPPPQPTRRSGGASWAPPVGFGAEPRPPTHFWHIWGPQNTSGGEKSQQSRLFPLKIHSIDDWGGACPPPEYAPGYMQHWVSGRCSLGNARRLSVTKVHVQLLNAHLHENVTTDVSVSKE